MKRTPRVALARGVWRTEAAGVVGIALERLVLLDECGVLTSTLVVSAVSRGASRFVGDDGRVSGGRTGTPPPPRL